jgi:hypothetical protein
LLTEICAKATSASFDEDLHRTRLYAEATSNIRVELMLFEKQESSTAPSRTHVEAILNRIL